MTSLRFSRTAARRAGCGRHDDPGRALRPGSDPARSDEEHRLRQLSRGAPRRQQRDAQTAAAYYRATLRHDPNNGELLDRTFLSLLVGGDINEAVQLRRPDSAGRQERPHRASGARRPRAQVEAICRGAPRPRAIGARTDHRSGGDAAHCLVDRWRRRQQRPRSPRSTSSPAPTGTRIFKDLHAGLILDMAGNAKEAGKRFEHAYKLDPIGAAGGRGLWQLAVAQQLAESRARAVRGIRQVVAAPSADGRGRSTSSRPDEKLPSLVANAQAGAAEALYGLGASLGRRGGEDLASSICSSRFTSRRIIRWRCSRSPIFTRG